MWSISHLTTHVVKPPTVGVTVTPPPVVELRANVESTFRECFLIQVAFYGISNFGRCHLP